MTVSRASSTIESLLPALVLAVSVVVGGCAGMSKIASEPTGRGERAEFNTSATALLPAVRRAVTQAGYEIVEDRRVDARTHAVIGLLSSSMKSWGQYCRVLVINGSSGRSSVRVHNVRRIEGNVTEDLDVMRKKVIAGIRSAANAGALSGRAEDMF